MTIMDFVWYVVIGVVFVLIALIRLGASGARQKKSAMIGPIASEIVLKQMKHMMVKKAGWDAHMSDLYCDVLDLLRCDEEADGRLIGYLKNGKKENTVVAASHLISLVDVLTTVALARVSLMPGVSSSLSFVFHHNRDTESKDGLTVGVCRYEVRVVKCGQILSVSHLDFFDKDNNFIGHGAHTKFMPFPWPVNWGINLLLGLHRCKLMSTLKIIDIVDGHVNKGATKNSTATPSYEEEWEEEDTVVLLKQFSNNGVGRITHGGFIANIIFKRVIAEFDGKNAARSLSNMSVDYLAPAVVRSGGTKVRVVVTWASRHNAVVRVIDCKRPTKVYACAQVSFYHG